MPDAGSTDKSRPRTLPPSTRPRNSLEDQLAAIWEQVLGVAPTGIGEDFFSNGRTTAQCEEMLRIVTALYHTRVSVQELAGNVSILNIASLLIATMPSGPLIQIRQGHSSCPALVILPGELQAGGMYSHVLADGVVPERAVYVLRPQGTGTTAAPDSVEAMAEDYLHSLRDFWAQGPHCVFGYCTSAPVAFELARRLHGAAHPAHALLLVEPKVSFEDDEIPQAATLAAQHATSPSRRAMWLFAHYLNVASRYRPGAYDGDVAIFLARTARARPRDPRTAFRQDTRIATRYVNGTHIGIVGRHARELAADIETYIASL